MINSLVMKACNTISNLSLGRNLLILLILCNQKNAALQDIEIWVDIEKCRSNQAPRLRATLRNVYVTYTGWRQNVLRAKK